MVDRERSPPDCLLALSACSASSSRNLTLYCQQVLVVFQGVFSLKHVWFFSKVVARHNPTTIPSYHSISINGIIKAYLISMANLLTSSSGAMSTTSPAHPIRLKLSLKLLLMTPTRRCSSGSHCCLSSSISLCA